MLYTAIEGCATRRHGRCGLHPSHLGLDDWFGKTSGNGERYGARKKEKGSLESKEKREKTSQAAEADRTLLLAHAERLQDFDHAGGVRASVRDEAGEYFQGRTV